MTYTLNRRQALIISLGGLAATALGWSSVPALATAEDAAKVIEEFTGGEKPGEGRVMIDLPEIADDGSAVPMTITVESPMTEESHVTEVLVVADGNPRPGVATFHFSPASGAAEVSTRIRLAQTENVIAVAKLNDGSFWWAKRAVKVTVGGCGIS
jgi:sulfur-oxidizing protein SoxY